MFAVCGKLPFRLKWRALGIDGERSFRSSRAQACSTWLGTESGGNALAQTGLEFPPCRRLMTQSARWQFLKNHWAPPAHAEASRPDGFPMHPGCTTTPSAGALRE
jgi:hypothetical protein